MELNRVSLENQILTWSSWDDMGVMELMLYDVTLKIPVGDHPAGSKFEAATFNGESSILSLEVGNDIWEQYSLVLSLGERLPNMDMSENTKSDYSDEFTAEE